MSRPKILLIALATVAITLFCVPPLIPVQASIVPPAMRPIHQDPLAPPLVWEPIVVMGDSIARGRCCNVSAGLANYIPTAINLAVYGNRTARVTDLLSHVHANRVYLHIGINDVWSDNPRAERDLADLLTLMRARRGTAFVIDQLGPLKPALVTPAREALRQRMNAQLRAVSVPNIRVLPFVATSLRDGMHPDAEGYAQQMPLVMSAMTSLALAGQVARPALTPFVKTDTAGNSVPETPVYAAPGETPLM